jgi:hypothetical protein
MQIDQLLSYMWEDYCSFNPVANHIYKLLIQEGEVVVNDHVALRTFNHPRLGIEKMARVFKDLGYQEKSDYHFKAKKLYAKHYEHKDPTKPKIFISELLLSQLSVDAQSLLHSIIEQISDDNINKDNFTYSGRSWSLSYKNYEKLMNESEYAAWVAAIGFRPNHFTVFINDLKKYSTVEKINEFLEAHSYVLNSSGGKIKGTPQELLEQSSTMAEQIDISFDEGIYKVPGCYYEFARRYADSHGKVYQGFIAASADKIFESTNRI